MNAEIESVVIACTRDSDAGTSSFPEIVARLAAAGVERYHADLVRAEKTYYLPNGDSAVVPDAALRSTPALAFTAAGVDAAVRASQAGSIDYREFCRRIAAAGCTGYLVARDGVTVHHAGDVDMSTYEVFEDIGRQYRVDATLLPIGGMLPVWYYRLRQRALDRGVHIDPDTALHIAERLGASHMVPVHWGTVHLRLGPPSAPRRRLAKVANGRGAERVRILGHGESLALPSRPSSGESG